MISVVLAAISVVSSPQVASPDLSALAKSAAEQAVTQFAEKKVTAEQIGISILRLDRAKGTWEAGDYQGAVDMYPASVVKLFYLAYVEELLEKKKVKMNPELERGIHDMITESSNDATALVLDTITGTTGGPALNERDLKKWMDKRAAVNRWYKSLGYPPLNANQKTWNEGPYGRERQGYGPSFELRNSLSPNVCTRLMAEIMLDKIVTPGRCAEMRKLLHRVTPAEGEADYQSRAFTGKILPKGFTLYSKAGYTDSVRHDVACVVAPNGTEIVLAVFTKGQSQTPELVPAISWSILRGLGFLKAAD